MSNVMTETTKNTIRRRMLLVVQFGILAAQLLALGFVAVGQANDATGMAMNTVDRVTIENAAAYRKDARAGAEDAACMTQFDVMNDLELKLDNDPADAELFAGEVESNRG